MFTLTLSFNGERSIIELNPAETCEAAALSVGLLVGPDKYDGDIRGLPHTVYRWLAEQPTKLLVSAPGATASSFFGVLLSLEDDPAVRLSMIIERVLSGQDYYGFFDGSRMILAEDPTYIPTVDDAAVADAPDTDVAQPSVQ